MVKISLSGKKILVAGATGAIGRAIVETALECGAWVAGSFFSDEEQAKELSSQGVVMFQADLTDRTQARRLVQETLHAAQSINGFVYAAGNTRDRTFGKFTDEEWDQVFKLHLGGLIACCQEILPAMRERRSGRVVAFGSLSGIIGRVGQTNYSAAKAATIGFMKTLAREVGRFGITANVVCPGFIDSKMTRSAPAEAWERARADSVLGTVSSKETVASFSAWLLSDLAQGVTGQVFHLDSRIH